MSRIRTVKPGLFKHEELYDAERETGLPLRLAFIGLFTVADKEGRFAWMPRTLKTDVLPHDDVDFARVLDALATRGWLVKYHVDGKVYGCISTFKKHQVINNREAESFLPSPDEDQGVEPTLTRAPRVPDAPPTPLKPAQGEGKGREGEGKGKGKGRTSLRSVARAKRAPLPEISELTDELRALAVKEGRDAEREFANCTDWCADNEQRLTAARFRRWLRNEYGKGKSNGPNGSGIAAKQPQDIRATARRVAEKMGLTGRPGADGPRGGVAVGTDHAVGSPTPTAANNERGPRVALADLRGGTSPTMGRAEGGDGDQIRTAGVEVLPLDRGNRSPVQTLRAEGVPGGLGAIPEVRPEAVESAIGRPEASGLREAPGGDPNRDGAGVGRAAEAVTIAAPAAVSHDLIGTHPAFLKRA